MALQAGVEIDFAGTARQQIFNIMGSEASPCLFSGHSAAVAWIESVDPVRVCKNGKSLLVAHRRGAARESCASALDRSAKLCSVTKGLERSELLQALRADAGEFALVFWDYPRRTLHLARSLLSGLPLCYATRNGLAVFASLPTALFAPGQGVLSLRALAQWYGAIVGADNDSMFAGVTKVAPGTLVSISANGIVVDRFASAYEIAEDGEISLEEAAERLRATLEVAVRDATAGHEGRVASLLSAGRDSSIVTMMAARHLGGAGQGLDSFTFSPGSDRRLGQTDLLIDEGPGAARIAHRVSNVRHHRVTTRGFNAPAAMDASYQYHAVPLGTPLSLYWWDTIQERASQAGAEILLHGGAGNLTISKGGTFYLADLLSDGRFRAWLKAAFEAARCPSTSLLSLLQSSAGGWMPGALHQRLQRWRGRSTENSLLPFLRSPLREMVQSVHVAAERRPPRRGTDVDRRLLGTLELADIGPQLRFGLSMRDPTADVRVVRSTLALPARLLVSRYDRRPVFERAFGDLLPREVVRAPKRAYQSMDWNLAHDLDALRDGAERYAANPIAAGLIDFGEVRRALAAWPRDRLTTFPELDRYGNGLFRAMALASFINRHCCDWQED